jgi:hypothetical protein
MKKGSLSAAFWLTLRNLSASTFAVLLTEALNATGSIDDLLLAGIKRMAAGADFNVKRLAIGRACLELVATTAGYVDFNVVGVNAFFHLILPLERDP